MPHHCITAVDIAAMGIPLAAADRTHGNLIGIIRDYVTWTPQEISVVRKFLSMEFPLSFEWFHWKFVCAGDFTQIIIYEYLTMWVLRMILSYCSTTEILDMYALLFYSN